MTAFVFSALPLLAVVFNILAPTSVSAQEAKGARYASLVENVNSIILSLDHEGRITFLNQYGQHFFGYSAKEIVGKPMLGTLTPLAGFQGRDLAAFLTSVLRNPDQHAFSVNQNILRNGQRVWIFWANMGIADREGHLKEVLRVGLDITARKRRLEALAQELRGISQLLNGRDWVQRKKLKEITERINGISEELERPWEASKFGDYQSVAPPQR
jgi:PAS domain S-box-containing protein